MYVTNCINAYRLQVPCAATEATKAADPAKIRTGSRPPSHQSGAAPGQVAGGAAKLANPRRGQRLLQCIRRPASSSPSPPAPRDLGLPWADAAAEKQIVCPPTHARTQRSVRARPDPANLRDGKTGEGNVSYSGPAISGEVTPGLDGRVRLSRVPIVLTDPPLRLQARRLLGAPSTCICLLACRRPSRRCKLSDV
jgi:hypothetical protein